MRSFRVPEMMDALAKLSFLRAATVAVSQACVVCRATQRALDKAGVLTKEDDSPVTIADYASQAVIVRAMNGMLGPVEVVAEEDAAMLRAAVAMGDTAIADAITLAVRTVWKKATRTEVLDAIDAGGGEPKKGAGFWTLDPIDGTKGFVRGAQYAIALAYIEDGRLLIGVLGCPNLSRDRTRAMDDPDPHGTLYCALAGGGSWESLADDPDATPLSIARRDALSRDGLVPCEPIEKDRTSAAAVAEVFARLGPLAPPVSLDGQGKYAVVARGQADVYLRVPSDTAYVERIWDHAAGALIAAEGGCVVSDLRGDPLDFGQGRGLAKNTGVVVAPPSLHPRVIAAIRDSGF